MKTITNVIYSAFVLFAALILPRVAHAQRVEVFNAKDRLADAQFTSLDSTGCIQTDVAVFAGSSKIKDTGSPLDVEPMVNVTYAVNDICNQVLLRSGFGSTNVTNFQMDSGLVAAHASATVPAGDDQNGTTIYLYVDLRLVGLRRHHDPARERPFRHAIVLGQLSRQGQLPRGHRLGQRQRRHDQLHAC